MGGLRKPKLKEATLNIQIVFGIYWYLQNHLWESAVGSLGLPWSIWCHHYLLFIPNNSVFQRHSEFGHLLPEWLQEKKRRGKNIYYTEHWTRHFIISVIHPTPFKVDYSSNCADKEADIKWDKVTVPKDCECVCKANNTCIVSMKNTMMKSLIPSF